MGIYFSRFARQSHENLLNFESMVNCFVIFYHFRINEQASSEQARRDQLGQKLGKRIRSIRQTQGMDT